MTVAAIEKHDTLVSRMTRLNGGSLELMAADGTTVIASVALDPTAGTVGSGTSTTATFGGFPKTVTPAVTGTAIASARLKDSSGTVRFSGYTVGLSGSGAQVILSKTTPAPGDSITVQAPFTLVES